MTWRPGAKAALIALAFVALAFVPLAAADHAYSHRYIVWGRVIDAENNPVPGVTVDLGYEKPFNPEGACANQPGTETDAYGPTRTSPVTNQFGEFTFCFHHHSMSRSTPGTGILRIDSLNVEKRIEFDGYMRYSYVVVKLDSTQPTANKTSLATEYTLQGRAWRPSGSDIRIESIRVYGDTVHNKPVNLTFTYNGKDPITLNTTTNNYGDYSVRVPVTERPTSGKVTMVIENETFTADIDGSTGISYIRAELKKPTDPFVTKFLIGLGIVAAVVVGGGALWFASNRVKASRDERILREQTNRKRANK
ncbi:MAG TPA: hypothetical protein VM370_05785 [Candidatus Thermoplasmatota archaeon]|nr:hypothetical protein [Candidatus Thermoplasmatota archaeon]